MRRPEASQGYEFLRMRAPFLFGLHLIVIDYFKYLWSYIVNTFKSCPAVSTDALATIGPAASEAYPADIITAEAKNSFDRRFLFIFSQNSHINLCKFIERIREIKKTHSYKPAIACDVFLSMKAISSS